MNFVVITVWVCCLLTVLWVICHLVFDLVIGWCVYCVGCLADMLYCLILFV